MQEFRNILLKIPFNLLISESLSLDCWFILYCLTNNREDLLITYTQDCNKIKTFHFEFLDNKGLINLISKEKITIDTVSITDKGRLLIKGKEEENIRTFEQCFQQLRDTYPIKVPGENGTFRRLHTDLARCRKLYNKILTNDIKEINQELHKKILKAISIQVTEFTKGKQLPFMQNLSTYLHQQNFLQYFDVNEEKQIVRGDDI